MNLKLAVALAVLLFATAAQADSITLGTGAGTAILIVPTGSTVTGEFTVATSDPYPDQGATFTLPDATGETQGQENDGDFGQINFTIPVNDLVLTWISAAGPAELWTNNGFTSFDCNCIMEQTVSFANGVTFIDWTNGKGYSGVEALSYTVGPVGTPEPSSLLLLGMGLLALIGMRGEKHSRKTSA